MRRGGFTLIEMTIAIAIAAVMFAAVVYGVGALTGARAKESSAELAGVIRSLYDTAALSGKTCRLVFELPGERDDDGEVTYRAECAQGAITAAADREEELREATRKSKKKDRVSDDDPRFRRLSADGQPTVEELMAREKERVEKAAKYSGFESDEVQSRTLPSSVKVSVWTQKQKKKVSNGTAYLYFFPQGYTERAYLYLTQGSNTWTITVQPLTGKTVVHPDEVEAPRS